MFNPLVSIIVPNYNCAPYLEERMQSIMEQSYSHYELILLDDCSTDGSREMLQRWSTHPKVSRVVMNEVNSGSAFVQWHRGLQLARGELVWIAEADDSCHPTLLSTLVAAFERQSALSFAFCRCKFVDEKSQETDHHSWRFRHVEGMDGRRFVKRYLYKGNKIWNGSCVLMRREYALRCGDDFTHYRACGDWLLWIELAMQGKVTAVGEPLNYFRRHTTCTTSSMKRCGQGQKETYKVFAYCCDHHLLSLWQKADVLMGMLRSTYLNRGRTVSEEVSNQIVETWMQGGVVHRTFCRAYMWVYPLYAKMLRAPFKLLFHRQSHKAS